MAVKRMDHVGIVVENLDAAITFVTELGLEAQGRMQVHDSWVDRVVGLDGVNVEITMMRTPDGHSKLELTKFLAPPEISPTSAQKGGWAAPHRPMLRPT